MIKSIALAAGISGVLGLPAIAAAGPYEIAHRLPLSDEGGWDIPTMDSGARLLYLSRSTHVDVVDPDHGALVAEIPDTPGVHGIALASDLGRGFISVGKANQVFMFDLASRAVLARIDVGEKPDSIVYDAGTKRVFAFNGHGDSVSVIDASAGKVIATVALGGNPELGRPDGAGHVFVNIENKNQLVALDARAPAVSSRWPLPGCDGPTGLALDAAHHRSFSVCANGAMSILDTQTGRGVATLPIGRHADGAEFDPQTGNAFSSNGEGTLTIVHENDPEHFVVAQTLTTQQGSKNLALDEKSRALYLPAASFGAPSGTQPKPPMVPGSVVVLVVAPTPPAP